MPCSSSTASGYKLMRYYLSLFTLLHGVLVPVISFSNTLQSPSAPLSPSSPHVVASRRIVKNTKVFYSNPVAGELYDDPSFHHQNEKIPSSSSSWLVKEFENVVDEKNHLPLPIGNNYIDEYFIRNNLPLSSYLDQISSPSTFSPTSLPTAKKASWKWKPTKYAEKSKTTSQSSNLYNSYLYCLTSPSVLHAERTEKEEPFSKVTVPVGSKNIHINMNNNNEKDDGSNYFDQISNTANNENKLSKKSWKPSTYTPSKSTMKSLSWNSYLDCLRSPRTLPKSSSSPSLSPLSSNESLPSIENITAEFSLVEANENIETVTQKTSLLEEQQQGGTSSSPPPLPGLSSKLKSESKPSWKRYNPFEKLSTNTTTSTSCRTKPSWGSTSSYLDFLEVAPSCSSSEKKEIDVSPSPSPLSPPSPPIAVPASVSASGSASFKGKKKSWKAIKYTPLSSSSRIKKQSSSSLDNLYLDCSSTITSPPSMSSRVLKSIKASTLVPCVKKKSWKPTKYKPPSSSSNIQKGSLISLCNSYLDNLPNTTLTQSLSSRVVKTKAASTFTSSIRKKSWKPTKYSPPLSNSNIQKGSSSLCNSYLDHLPTPAATATTSTTMATVSTPISPPRDKELSKEESFRTTTESKNHPFDPLKFSNNFNSFEKAKNDVENAIQNGLLLEQASLLVDSIAQNEEKEESRNLISSLSGFRDKEQKQQVEKQISIGVGVGPYLDQISARAGDTFTTTGGPIKTSGTPKYIGSNAKSSTYTISSSWLPTSPKSNSPFSTSPSLPSSSYLDSFSSNSDTTTSTTSLEGEGNDNRHSTKKELPSKMKRIKPYQNSGLHQQVKPSVYTPNDFFRPMKNFPEFNELPRVEPVAVPVGTPRSTAEASSASTTTTTSDSTEKEEDRLKILHEEEARLKTTLAVHNKNNTATTKQKAPAALLQTIVKPSVYTATDSINPTAAKSSNRRTLLHEQKTLENVAKKRMLLEAQLRKMQEEMERLALHEALHKSNLIVIQNESNQRNLLQTRLKMGRKIAQIEKHKAEQKVLEEARLQKIRQEENQRILLKARLEVDQHEINKRAIINAKKRTIRLEKSQRLLLETRMQINYHEANQKAILEETRLRKIQQELNQRSLLAARIQVDQHEAKEMALFRAWIQTIIQEMKQRSLLEARLQVDQREAELRSSQKIRLQKIQQETNQRSLLQFQLQLAQDEKEKKSLLEDREQKMKQERKQRLLLQSRVQIDRREVEKNAILQAQLRTIQQELIQRSLLEVRIQIDQYEAKERILLEKTKLQKMKQELNHRALLEARIRVEKCEAKQNALRQYQMQSAQNEVNQRKLLKARIDVEQHKAKEKALFEEARLLEIKLELNQRDLLKVRILLDQHEAQQAMLHKNRQRKLNQEINQRLLLKSRLEVERHDAKERALLGAKIQRIQHEIKQRSLLEARLQIDERIAKQKALLEEARLKILNQETNQRALLEARIQTDQHAAKERDLIKAQIQKTQQEINQRSILETRIQIEQHQMKPTVHTLSKSAKASNELKYQYETKNEPQLQTIDTTTERRAFIQAQKLQKLQIERSSRQYRLKMVEKEKKQRSILKTRLQMEQLVSKQRKLHEFRLQKIHQDSNQRLLLEARIEMDQHLAREKSLLEARLQSIQQELIQRSLLRARILLDQHEIKEKALLEQIRFKKMRQEENQRSLLKARVRVDQYEAEQEALQRSQMQSIRNEKNQRALLEARVQVDQHEAEQKALQRSQMQSIRNEKNQRALLEARIQVKQHEATEKALIEEARLLKIKQETNQRSLLQARIQVDLHEADQKKILGALQKVQQEVKQILEAQLQKEMKESKERAVLEKIRLQKIRQEINQRALLKTRIQVDKLKGKRMQSIKNEINQRALLKARLQVEQYRTNEIALLGEHQLLQIQKEANQRILLEAKQEEERQKVTEKVLAKILLQNIEKELTQRTLLEARIQTDQHKAKERALAQNRQNKIQQELNQRALLEARIIMDQCEKKEQYPTSGQLEYEFFNDNSFYVDKEEGNMVANTISKPPKSRNIFQSIWFEVEDSIRSQTEKRKDKGLNMTTKDTKNVPEKSEKNKGMLLNKEVREINQGVISAPIKDDAIINENMVPEIGAKKESVDAKLNLKDSNPVDASSKKNDFKNIATEKSKPDKKSLTDARKKTLSDLDLDYLSDVGLDYLVDSYINEDESLSDNSGSPNSDGDFLLNSLKETASKIEIPKVGEGIAKSLDLAKGFFDNNALFGKKETIDSKSKSLDPTISMSENPQQNGKVAGGKVNEIDRNKIRGTHKIEAGQQEIPGGFQKERSHVNKRKDNQTLYSSEETSTANGERSLTTANATSKDEDHNEVVRSKRAGRPMELDEQKKNSQQEEIQNIDTSKFDTSFFAASREVESETLISQKTSQSQMEIESKLQELKTACNELESVTSPFHEYDEISDKKSVHKKSNSTASTPFFATQDIPKQQKEEKFSAAKSKQSTLEEKTMCDEKITSENERELKEKKSILYETDFNTDSKSISGTISNNINKSKKIVQPPTKNINPNSIFSQFKKENQMESKLKELKMACNDIDNMTFEFHERDELSNGIKKIETDQVLLRDLSVGNNNEPEILDGRKGTFNIDETIFRSSSKHKKNVSDLKKKETQVLNDLKLACDELTSQFQEHDDISNKYEQRGSKLLETILASQEKFEQQEKMHEEKKKLEIIQTETKMPETKVDSKDLEPNLKNSLPKRHPEGSKDYKDVIKSTADEISIVEARKKVLGDLELDYLDDVGLGYLVDSHIDEDTSRGTRAISSDNEIRSAKSSSIAGVGEGIMKSLGNFGFSFFDKK